MADKTSKQKIGQIGEDLACKFLVKHGFSIVTRNYLKPFGEIDIICSKNGITHFVEVKCVSRLTNYSNVDNYRPEDNIHNLKLVRIARTVQAYIFETDLKNDEWKFDIITVQLDNNNKTAKVGGMFDLIL